jgi:FdrA protein
MAWHVRVVRNRYADSVRLMGVARALRERDGISGCELGMGTPANLATLARLGARSEAEPADLVIAVDADDAAAGEALDEAERRLAETPARAEAAEARPRTLTAADGANVAVVSVPGDYAVLEAHRALSAGMHVFLFSDHVGEADELALKRRGAELGLLVMGPGCGTAMLGGVGLGFANTVREGPVGIVAAAGTGAQEVACLLDAAGTGVSQIVGVGGRDLSEAIGGIGFREGLRLLAADDRTETVVAVSKPPSAEAVRALADAVPAGKRVVAAFVGWPGGDAPFEVHPTLEDAALAAAGAERSAVDGLEAAVDERRGRSAGRRLLALYSGGTLAHEAEGILAGVDANVLDLGDEEYTRGRPHPMVDLDLRLDRLAAAAVDEAVGCLLFDVVLGYGSHPDPAPELAAALRGCEATVIARVCGTAADPQHAPRQAAALREAGVLVAPSNAAAARLAARAVAPPTAGRPPSRSAGSGG